MKRSGCCLILFICLVETANGLPVTTPGNSAFLATQTVYPSLTGNILRGDGQTTSLQSLVATTGAPSDVETDGNLVYWTEDSTGAVRRIGLDGTGLVTLYSPPPNNDHPVRLAIDPLRNRMYWSTSGTSLIRVASTDGSNLSILPLPAGATPYALAIDSANQKLYWTSTFNKHFYRTDLTTLESELLFTSGSGLPSLFGLTLDSVGAKLYWTDRQGPVIRRANLDGSDLETIVTGSGGSIFRDIEIDVAQQAIIWVDDRNDVENKSFVRRASLDGANVQTLGETRWQMNGLALIVPEPLDSTILGPTVIAAVALAHSTRRTNVHRERRGR